MDQEGTSLASEILAELKKTCRRWFIAFCIMVALEICTIAGFMWYISLPVDDMVTVENDDGNASYIGRDLNGGLYNGENYSETSPGSASEDFPQ